jgi:hypothetical protein
MPGELGGACTPWHLAIAKRHGDPCRIALVSRQSRWTTHSAAPQSIDLNLGAPHCAVMPWTHRD